MTIFDHPILQYLVPYFHLGDGRDNLDLLQLPPDLRELALQVVTNCPSCGAVVYPFRARAKSSRSRIAHTEYEHRLFYAPTCPTEIDPGCSRTAAAKAHKEVLRAMFGLPRRSADAEVGEAARSVEVYDALCLQEPWLELILLGIKTLETRTKCLRKLSGLVLLTSSKNYDQVAWDAPGVGGRLGELGRERALRGLGKFAALVQMSGFRPGIPGVEDAAACIPIALPGGKVRQVSAISDVRRVDREDTVRVRPDGSIVSGVSQGFFRVPRSSVHFVGDAARAGVV